MKYIKMFESSEDVMGYIKDIQSELEDEFPEYQYTNNHQSILFNAVDRKYFDQSFIDLLTGRLKTLQDQYLEIDLIFNSWKYNPNNLVVDNIKSFISRCEKEKLESILIFRRDFK